ncbi:hypothetical protein C8046_13845 [Serinibacter arcticus]|uniref:Uncharacterized protein n=1 Tax=Serinibacter arcticus TaxID=1655435 RepID=A0A2U1ZX74_9MICO|nr:hypothetical protein C8046_13845 [Serinibacter arcticus]
MADPAVSVRSVLPEARSFTICVNVGVGVGVGEGVGLLEVDVSSGAEDVSDADGSSVVEVSEVSGGVSQGGVPQAPRSPTASAHVIAVTPAVRRLRWG